MWHFIWNLPTEHPLVFLCVLFFLVLIALGQDSAPQDEFHGGD
jgi:hypothetical protein